MKKIASRDGNNYCDTSIDATFPCRGLKNIQKENLEK